eukprot:sb/3461812/
MKTLVDLLRWVENALKEDKTMYDLIVFDGLFSYYWNTHRSVYRNEIFQSILLLNKYLPIVVSWHPPSKSPKQFLNNSLKLTFDFISAGQSIYSVMGALYDMVSTYFTISPGSPAEPVLDELRPVSVVGLFGRSRVKPNSISSIVNASIPGANFRDDVDKNEIQELKTRALGTCSACQHPPGQGKNKVQNFEGTQTDFLKPFLSKRWNALQSPLLHCRATPQRGPVAYAKLKGPICVPMSESLQQLVGRLSKRARFCDENELIGPLTDLELVELVDLLRWVENALKEDKTMYDLIVFDGLFSYYWNTHRSVYRNEIFQSILSLNKSLPIVISWHPPSKSPKQLDSLLTALWGKTVTKRLEVAGALYDMVSTYFTISPGSPAEPVLDELRPVSVVGLFGRSRVKPNSISSIVNASIPGANFRDDVDKNEIQCYHDGSSGILYLYLPRHHRADQMEMLEKQSSYSDYHDESVRMKVDEVQQWLWILSVCHYVLLFHPSQTFDISYIRLFRTVQRHLLTGSEGATRLQSPQLLFVFQSNPADYHDESVRMKVDEVQQWLWILSVCHYVLLFHPSQTFDISYIRLFRTVQRHLLTDSEGATRLQSPQLLFVFQSNPASMHLPTKKGRSTLMQQCRTLTLEMETQIYHIFRKCRLLNSELLSIPAPGESKEPFVLFVEGRTRLSAESGGARHVDTGMFYVLQLSATTPQYTPSNPDELLSGFITRNVRQWAEITSKITLRAWYDMAIQLQDIYCKDFVNRSSLTKVLNVEEEFSERRGKKMLPIAITAYSANLPEYYTVAQHTSNLNHAIHLLKSRVKGPAQERYVATLTQDCTDIWEDGRRGCEVLSLTELGGRWHVVETKDSSPSQGWLQPDISRELRPGGFGGQSPPTRVQGRVPLVGDQGAKPPEIFQLNQANFRGFNHL